MKQAEGVPTPRAQGAHRAEQERGQGTPPRTRAHRGQVLVIFSGVFLILLLMSALVIDLAWLWSNTLRIQRTADSAALAGVVYLPQDVPNAIVFARKEATRNGYNYLSPGITVTPSQDAQNPRRLNVRVTAPVQTFFLGLIGMHTIVVSRRANAEYVLPVPMGSPENYYGVFGDVRNATMTTTTTSTTSSTGSSQTAGPRTATTAPAGTPWTTSSGTLVDAVSSNNNVYARTNTNGATQQWSAFGFLSGGSPPIPAPITSGNPTTAINIIGLQVSIEDAFVSAACANSTIGVALSWNNGTNWSTIVNTANLGTNVSNGDYTLGNNNNTTPWGTHTWIRNDFADTSFRVRLTANKGCGTAGTTLNVDRFRVSVFYTITTTTTTTTTSTATATYQLRGPGAFCANGAFGCYVGTPSGGGQVLNPRGFWGTMNTQGAENVNGDAYQPYYDTRTSGVAVTCPAATLTACHGPVDFYNYAIEMQPNTTGGRVYIFDPVFCETSAGSGTGDRHFSGSAAVGSFYELYSDPNNTPFILTDDVLVASSGNTFQSMAHRDSTMGGSNGSECRQSDTLYGDARDYHNSWYLLNTGGAGLTGGPAGTTYRLHTTSTDPSNAAVQQGTDGEQSFAIYATSAQAQAGGASCLVAQPPSSCGYPRVYGLGAMQAFTPLSASGSAQTSTFYLAQIDPIHKTKTLQVRLWDPGDTAPLTASIEILYPDNTAPGGYRAAAVTFASQRGTTNSGSNSGCSPTAPVGNWKRTTASTTPITTSTGASLGIFNGCWLTIDAVIPASYTGNSTLASDFGWWKIRYTMNGNGTSNDVTTWTADIRGNPVHLVEP
jgi:Flp pilus assembly protein TadG